MQRAIACASRAHRSNPVRRSRHAGDGPRCSDAGTARRAAHSRRAAGIDQRRAWRHLRGHDGRGRFEHVPSRLRFARKALRHRGRRIRRGSVGLRWRRVRGHLSRQRRHTRSGPWDASHRAAGCPLSQQRRRHVPRCHRNGRPRQPPLGPGRLRRRYRQRRTRGRVRHQLRPQPSVSRGRQGSICRHRRVGRRRGEQLVDRLRIWRLRRRRLAGSVRGRLRVSGSGEPAALTYAPAQARGRKARRQQPAGGWALRTPPARPCASTGASR